MKPGKSRAMLQGIQCKPAEDIPHKYKTSYTLIGMDRYLQTASTGFFDTPITPVPLSHLLSLSQFILLLSTLFFFLGPGSGQLFLPMPAKPNFSPHPNDATQMMAENPSEQGLGELRYGRPSPLGYQAHLFLLFLYTLQ